MVGCSAVLPSVSPPASNYFSCFPCCSRSFSYCPFLMIICCQCSFVVLFTIIHASYVSCYHRLLHTEIQRSYRQCCTTKWHAAKRSSAPYCRSVGITAQSPKLISLLLLANLWDSVHGCDVPIMFCQTLECKFSPSHRKMFMRNLLKSGSVKLDAIPNPSQFLYQYFSSNDPEPKTFSHYACLSNGKVAYIFNWL